MQPYSQCDPLIIYPDCCIFLLRLQADNISKAREIMLQQERLRQLYQDLQQQAAQYNTLRGRIIEASEVRTAGARQCARHILRF